MTVVSENIGLGHWMIDLWLGLNVLIHEGDIGR